MGNIRNRFTELISKTGQNYIPLLLRFEEFHASVLEIKESTMGLYSAAFSLHFNQPESHLSNENVERASTYFLKDHTRELKFFYSFTCLSQNKRRLVVFFCWCHML